MAKNQVYKKRCWVVVVYPDSARSDWRDLLVESGVKGAISPLHDKDVDEGAEGGPRPKKPHWHVLLIYDGPVSQASVKRFTDQLVRPGKTGVLPQGVESLRGQYRYLTHADNPDKAQYSRSDIQFLGGFGPLDVGELTRSELAELRHEVRQIVMDNDIFELADLIELVAALGREDLDDYIATNTIYWGYYLRSRHYRHLDELKE